jgi:hypothetical protein
MTGRRRKGAEEPRKRHSRIFVELSLILQSGVQLWHLIYSYAPFLCLIPVPLVLGHCPERLHTSAAHSALPDIPAACLHSVVLFVERAAPKRLNKFQHSQVPEVHAYMRKEDSGWADAEL